MEYHMNFYSSEEFYETQAQIDNARNNIEAAISELENNPVLDDLKSYLTIALDEAKRLEREY